MESFFKGVEICVGGPVSRIWYGSGYLARFCILDLVWKVFLEVVKFVWADLYLGFSMGAAISLAFDYFSILTRVSEILFFLFDFISTFCPLCLGGRKTRG